MQTSVGYSQVMPSDAHGSFIKGWLAWQLGGFGLPAEPPVPAVAPPEPPMPPVGAAPPVPACPAPPLALSAAVPAEPPVDVVGEAPVPSAELAPQAVTESATVVTNAGRRRLRLRAITRRIPNGWEGR